MKLRCEWCGETVHRTESNFIKTGPHVFCNKKCFGLSRRKGKTVTEKKADKAAYDHLYRAKNLRRIKKRKKVYFQKTYDPKKARIERKKNMPRHVAYCQQPAYRTWKRRYDEKHRARKQFGDFSESAMLLKKLESEIGKRMSDYEIRLQQGTLNKCQKRKKALV